MKLLKLRIAFVLAVAPAIIAQGPAKSAIVFYNNNKPLFDVAVGGFTFLGTETFEESSLADGQAVSFNGPLSQTSTTSPYASGITQPMTVSINGGGQLAAFKNDLTVATTVVIANSSNDTLDWTFGGTGLNAIGLNPVTFSGANQLRLETITVFDTGGTMLDSITVSAHDSGVEHLGIVAIGADRIGRLNFNGMTTGGSSVSEGADNAALYVPEASAFLLTACAGVVTYFSHLASARRRNQDKRPSAIS
jgi:hypothetical protein